MTHVAANVVQTNFRARVDSGNEATPTWIAALNTNWTQDTDADFRVRFEVDETAGGDANNLDLEIFYNLNSGGWNAVTASSPVQFATFTGATDGDATTQQIGSGAFIAGELDSNASVTAISLNNDGTEMEYCLLIDSAQVADEDTIELRVEDGTTALDSYTNSPTVTVNEPGAALDVIADAGSYSVSGVDANLEYGFSIDAEAGSYSLAGVVADLEYGVSVEALAGSYALTGVDATLTHGFDVIADAGSYSIVGATADLLSPGEWDNTHFRWRADDDDEANATWLAAVNTNGLSFGFDENVRIRFGVTETSGSVNLSEKCRFRLMYNEDGGGWLTVSARGNKARPVALEDSPHLADTGGATQQLTAGSYIDGLYVTQFNATAANQNDAVADGNWEIEWCIRFTSDSDFPAASGQVFEFRMQIDPANGIDFADFDAYTETPQITFEAKIMPEAGVYTLVGVDAGLAAGIIMAADADTYAVAGVDAGLNIGIIVAADAGNYTVAGADVDFLYGYAVQADAGSYAVSGVDAAPLYGYAEDALVGSYTISGVDAELTITADIEVIADAGTYAVSGVAASLEQDYVLEAVAGSYAVSGVDNTLAYGFSLVAAAGAYAVAGADVTLNYGYFVDSVVGTYTTSGADTSLEYGRLVAANSGSYSISGNTAALEYGFMLLTDAGSHVVSGVDLALEYGYLLEAAAGSYSVSGVDADLLVSGSIILAADAGVYAVSGVDASLLLTPVSSGGQPHRTLSLSNMWLGI